MKNKPHPHLYPIFSMLLIAAFFLSSCAVPGNAQSLVAEEVDNQPVQPVEFPSEPVEEQPHFVTPEEARDIVIAYLLDKYTLEAPSEWLSQDQTPENLLGASSFLFTSGAWVATVDAPVVAPEYLVYRIKIDHLASGLLWQGEVDASGALIELSLAEPLPVLSPADACEAAVAFIVANYGWSSPDAWVEQSIQPTEKAGVRHTYTSAAWVIQVEYLAAAPIVPEYHVIADHISLVARWTGTVKASGEIIVEDYQ